MDYTWWWQSLYSYSRQKNITSIFHNIIMLYINKKVERYVVFIFVIKLFQNGFIAKFVLNVTQWRNDITLNGQMLYLRYIRSTFRGIWHVWTPKKCKWREREKFHSQALQMMQMTLSSWTVHFLAKKALFCVRNSPSLQRRVSM